MHSSSSFAELIVRGTPSKKKLIVFFPSLACWALAAARWRREYDSAESVLIEQHIVP